MLKRKCINWYVNPKHRVVFWNGWVIENYVAIHQPSFYKEIMTKRENPVLKTTGFLPDGCIMGDAIEGKADELFDYMYREDAVRCDIGYIHIYQTQYAIQEKVFKRLKSWINAKAWIKARFMVKEYKGDAGVVYSPFLIVEDESGNEKITICGLLERVIVK